MRPRSQPSPVIGWFRPVDFKHASLVETFPFGALFLFRKQHLFLENWQKITDYALLICEAFLRRHRFPTPMSFAVDLLNIEIYTDACERSPIETDVINWEYGVGIGGILFISGKLCAYCSLEVNDEIAHWLKGVKSLRRLICSPELIGTYGDKTVDTISSA